MRGIVIFVVVLNSFYSIFLAIRQLLFFNFLLIITLPFFNYSTIIFPAGSLMTALGIYSAGRNWVRLFTDEVIVADIVLIILPIFVVYAVSTYVREHLTIYIMRNKRVIYK